MTQGLKTFTSEGHMIWNGVQRHHSYLQQREIGLAYRFANSDIYMLRFLGVKICKNLPYIRHGRCISTR